MRQRIGYVLSSEQFPVSRLVTLARTADLAGFPIAWTSDHFQPWQPNEGHSSFAWATLAAASQVTARLALGTGVTCPIYRYNPAVVAEAFATLGQLAPGRIFLGVGSGEALNEQASGAGWGPYEERAARLAEALTIIRELWKGDTVNYAGQFWTLEAARLYDLPSHPVPLYVAANGPHSARLAGQFGDGWITTAKCLQDPECKEAFEEGARAAGKDPAQLEIILETFAVLGTRDEALKGAELWRFIKKPWAPGYLDNPDPADIQRRAEAEITLEEVIADWLVGGQPEHVEGLQKLFDLGATTVFAHSPQPDQAAFIEWYARKVLPEFGGARVNGRQGARRN